MSYSLTLIADVIVAVLLVVTIGYAIVLNKRLGRLRRDKAALEKLVSTFGESTARAEDSIERLKNTAEQLQDRMEKAESLRDDLAFLIDRGGKTADSLEALVRDARDRVGVNPRPAPSAAPAPAADAGPITPKGINRGPLAEIDDDAPRTAADDAPADDDATSDAERELLKAIRSAG